MRELRYGLIGAGMMGQEHIRNIALLDGVRVAAIADPDSGMRAASCALAGADCAAFSDHRDLLAAEPCDACVIAAPNDLHHPILLDVPATAKPILCEKPLCTTTHGRRRNPSRMAQAGPCGQGRAGTWRQEPCSGSRQPGRRVPTGRQQRAPSSSGRRSAGSTRPGPGGGYVPPGFPAKGGMKVYWGREAPSRERTSSRRTRGKKRESNWTGPKIIDTDSIFISITYTGTIGDI